MNILNNTFITPPQYPKKKTNLLNSADNIIEIKQKYLTYLIFNFTNNGAQKNKAINR